MRKTLAFALSVGLTACGGNAFQTDETGGAAGNAAGGGQAGARAVLGGTTGLGGRAGQPTGGSSADGGVDCSMAGCAEPPLCSTGCTAPCGCCSCTDGDVQGALVCAGGCWAPAADAGPPGVCLYGGQSYPAGASFAASDGCNQCSCQDGGLVACTLMACLACTGTEFDRRYVATSTSECSVIRYSCPAYTIPFTNDCGCGCQQQPSCPEYFDCMPAVAADGAVSSCDPDALLATCPYSKIAY